MHNEYRNTVYIARGKHWQIWGMTIILKVSSSKILCSILKTFKFAKVYFPKCVFVVSLPKFAPTKLKFPSYICVRYSYLQSQQCILKQLHIIRMHISSTVIRTYYAYVTRFVKSFHKSIIYVRIS